MMNRLAVCLLVIQAQAMFSGRADMVRLPVSVTDANGHMVTGLTADNFHIYEDGQPQAVAVFHEGDTPVTVGIVVDHSQSMRSKLAPLAEAVALLAQAARSDDEMFVVNFSDRVSRDPPAAKPFTHDGEELRAALLAVPAAGQTALYDAVIAGLEHLRAGQWDRRALIVVSDGGDNASVHTYAEVRAAARESQAVIYAVGLVDESSGEDERPDVLKRLCTDSGGVAAFPRTDAEIAAAVAQVGRDLREQYTLGFIPATRTPGAVHKIAVTASGRGLGTLHVRTRADYVEPRGRPLARLDPR